MSMSVSLFLSLFQLFIAAINSIGRRISVGGFQITQSERRVEVLEGRVSFVESSKWREGRRFLDSEMNISKQTTNTTRRVALSRTTKIKGETANRTLGSSKTNERFLKWGTSVIAWEMPETQGAI